MKCPSRFRVSNVWTGVVLALAVFSLPSWAAAKTLRLFVVGNSFSNNAIHYLPDLARAGGHELIIHSADTGGCSFERHWNAVEADRANPGDPKGKIYRGKSLGEHLGDGQWNVITIQQYSMMSPDPTTYRPFASKLHAHLRQLQPGAEIVIHQTWAYRADAAKFGQVGPGRFAANQREMRATSRAAYRQLARELGVRVIPTGDAFWRVDSDPQWGFKPDMKFDRATAKPPALPDQTHSLHVGYRWKGGKLGMDANHANVAGEYLGALVWYAFLFDESPEKLAFGPRGIEPDFAAHLRRVAAEVVRDTAAASRRAAGAVPVAAR
ncbi:MAG: DUF4886 domain-containing protein [Opitutaceae bacterium]|nr:DUF4886 domain-containing protein [Opitutaceae bacterium]